MAGKRDTSIDSTRAFAVILMIVNHVLLLLTPQTNPYLVFIMNICGYFAFTMFLFVSGISMFNFYIDTNDRKETEKRLSIRIIKLIGAYYVLAFINTSPSIKTLDMSFIVQILTFTNIPKFSEYLLPFIIYGIVTKFLLAHFFKKKENDKRDLEILLVGSVVIFYAGIILYQITQFMMFSPFFRSVIAIFIGYVDLTTFPALQYASVFALGLYIGHLTKSKKYQSVKQIMWLLTISSIMLFASSLFIQLPYINTFTRWPPSALFTVAGLVMSFILFRTFRRFHKAVFYSKLSYNLSKHSIGILIAHLMMIRLVEAISPTKTNNVVFIVGWTVFLLILYPAAIFVFNRTITFRRVS